VKSLAPQGAFTTQIAEGNRPDDHLARMSSRHTKEADVRAALARLDDAMQLPPLSTLRLFEAAGRRLSFREAASELHVTPSAVSHGIQSLEDWLGVPLFARSTRGLALTAAGEAYLPQVREALRLVAEGAAAIPGRGGMRTVRLTCAPVFALKLLLPRLGEFRALYPGIDVVIDTSPRRLDLAAERIDLGVRMQRGPTPGTIARELLRPRLVPVASPAYVAERLGGDKEQFLTAGHLLRLTGVTEDWDTWLAAIGHAGPIPRAPLRFDNVHLTLEAAMRGYGVAMGRRPTVDEELKSGRLVTLSDREIEIETGFWLVRAADPNPRSEVLAFADWLVGVMEALRAQR
jgi:LysR family transcriptional regulator, glycine cleavage system transcriptional activator